MTAVALPGKAIRRLLTERDAWLTTVRPDGQPQTSVVWCCWHDSALWIRSRPGARKVANIRAQPRVAVNLNSNGRGGDVVTLEGTAELVVDLPRQVRDAYIAKYARAIRTGLRMTPDEMLADYSASIRVDVRRARVW